MKIETKFSVGDKVCTVSNHSAERIVKCDCCSNTGKVTIQNEEFVCPKCNGKATHRVYCGHKWFVSNTDTIIGQVRFEHTGERFTNDEVVETKIQYMLSATGVRSGTIWNEKELFGSRKEADEFCNERNLTLLPDEV